MIYPNDAFEDENEELYNSPFPGETIKTYWPFYVIGVGMILAFGLWAWSMI
jgi:hypothetical protein